MEKAQIMRLMIPFAGKMFKSSLDSSNKALCFCINKGYIESDELEPLYYLRETIAGNKDWIYNVGKIDKIHLGGKNFCYRQRIFFTDFLKTCQLCKENGIIVQTTPAFKISITNIVSCSEELKYLEWYANVFSESVDNYLTNTCKVQMYSLLNDNLMLSPLKYEVEEILKHKEGYLERAPFLAMRYDNVSNTSQIFIPAKNDDRRLYTTDNLQLTDTYGFSERLIEKDTKKGVFKHEG